MKKKMIAYTAYVLFTAIIVSFTLTFSSCGQNIVESSGNVSNYGYLLVDKNDVYYTKIVESDNTYYSNIYKYSTKDKKETLVASTEADYPNEMNSFLSLDNGDLYFLTNYLNDSVKEASANISKVKPDGKNITPTKLFEDDISCAFMQIVNGVIYYYDDTEQAIYRMNANGTQKKFICNAVASGIAIGGGKIYYAEDDAIMQVSANGGDPKELYDFSDEGFYIDSIVLEGDYIYYLDDSYSMIGRIKTDGSENKEIYRVSDDSSEYINCFNVNGGVVYFVAENYGDEGNYAVLSLNPGSKSPKLIVSDKSELGDIYPLAIWNDTIYFVGMPVYETILDSDYVWFTVKKSGGTISPFQPLNQYSDSSDTVGELRKNTD
ncbi:MAG: DUF5050 domain-containing protein [Oscillospiraceae bacterium]|nr:DUF5050 domain-containing protein [Oscillospiraceae bacterium]